MQTFQNLFSLIFSDDRKFDLGQMVITTGASEEMSTHGMDAFDLLSRHAHGDFGDLCTEDRKTNAQAIKHGSRVMSTYPTPSGRKIWVITEADRSVTTLLLPSEY